MVVRRGSQIRAYANGQLLTTVTDATLPANGWQGLVAEASAPNADLRFDNFRAFSVRP